jgi:hypothetical protein
MAAKARTLAVTAASSGETASIASRPTRSASASWSGLVMIQWHNLAEAAERAVSRHR